jgi:hypothetical protein
MAEALNCDLFAFVRGTLKARSGLDAFFLLSTPKYAKKIYENQASHAYAEKKCGAYRSLLDSYYRDLKRRLNLCPVKI